VKILIAVTHLLGAGHLTRAAALGRAFAAAGHTAVLVSGGVPAPLVRLGGARLVQLPPVGIAGFEFGRPIGADGQPAGTALFDARRAALLDTLAGTAPDVILTELFPFGRRILATEFLALVDAARARPDPPLILASVRDILVPPDRPSKVEEAHARIAALYDGVLVHGDPEVAALDASWPVDDTLAKAIRYTGYVDEGEPVPASSARSGILVAAGSSSAGLGLFRAAIAAARLTPDLSWRILVGHGVPDAELESLAGGLPPGTVMRARPDYRHLLAGAAVSVSQCGYNTAVDLLATGTPAVLVPFEAGRETEQRLRAERLAALGRARIVPEADLTPHSLIAAVREAAREGPSPIPDAAPTGRPRGPAFDGSTRTVAVVEEMLRRRPAPLGVSRPSTDRLAPLRDALDRAGDDGRRVDLWWRDDDAVAATPALERLLALVPGAPILIAAIPARVAPSLGQRLAGLRHVSLAVHGLTHDNHAPSGAKAAEFGPHRPLPVLCREAADALAIARDRLPPGQILPVFVPPWNRMADDLARDLPRLGYAGLSAAGGPAIAGLSRADAGLDMIDWRGSRSLRDPAALVGALVRQAGGGAQAPLGLLTHHLAHDEAIWDFLAELLPLLARHPAVRLRDPKLLFPSTVDAPRHEPMSKPTECPRAV
jgi:predicted glycosyltransferase